MFQGGVRGHICSIRTNLGGRGDAHIKKRQSAHRGRIWNVLRRTVFQGGFEATYAQYAQISAASVLMDVL